MEGVAEGPPAVRGTVGAPAWLSEPSITVSAAVATIAANLSALPPDTRCNDAAAAGGGMARAAGAGDAAPKLRLQLHGQVCRRRLLSKNLIFLTLRHAESCAEWDGSAARVQCIAKLQSLGPQQMAEVKRLVKLGDMMQVEGTVHNGAMGPELQLERTAVVERWAISCRGAGFKPDIEPPSDTTKGAAAASLPPPAGTAATPSDPLACGADVAPICKYWVNTGVCRRAGCRFTHRAAGDERPWAEIRTEWQKARSAKRHANRRTMRLAGDDAGADGVGVGGGGSSEGRAGAHGDRSQKSARAAVFAEWLIENFGRATLSAGGGCATVSISISISISCLLLFL